MSITIWLKANKPFILLYGLQGKIEKTLIPELAADQEIKKLYPWLIKIHYSQYSGLNNGHNNG